MGEFGPEKNLQRTSKVGKLEGNNCFVCILKNEKCLFVKVILKTFKGEKEDNNREQRCPKEI